MGAYAELYALAWEPSCVAVHYLKDALQAIEGSDVGSYGPDVFVNYCQRNGISPPKSTAAVLSRDTLGQVPPYLREQGAMVFRMGRNLEANRTEFVVAKVPDGPEVFFLCDDEVFSSAPVTTVDPLGEDRFLAYRLVPKLQEMALVNLGLGCGALGEALGLEEPVVHAPAMLSSTYTFRLRLHPRLDREFDHKSGQVQLDGLFSATRNGERQLFVLEAKFVKTNQSLAKHKLVYPTLAMRQDVGVHLPVIPIYLSVLERPDAYVYRMAECRIPDVSDEAPTLSSLEPERVHQVEVKRPEQVL